MASDQLKTIVEARPAKVSEVIDYLLKKGYKLLSEQSKGYTVWSIEQRFHWSASTSIDFLFRDDLEIDSRKL